MDSSGPDGDCEIHVEFAFSDGSMLRQGLTLIGRIKWVSTGLAEGQLMLLDIVISGFIAICIVAPFCRVYVRLKHN